MVGQGLEVVFTKPVSLQSELCNLKPPKDKLQHKDVLEKCGVSYRGETAQWFTDRDRQHQYAVRTVDAKNSFFANAACHHGVDGLVEEGAEVELFRWKDAQFLDLEEKKDQGVTLHQCL